MKRREKIKKVGKLTSRWELLRECKKFLEEKSQVWEKRSREETVRKIGKIGKENFRHE